jgi:hypothetical protein
MLSNCILEFLKLQTTHHSNMFKSPNMQFLSLNCQNSWLMCHFAQMQSKSMCSQILETGILCGIFQQKFWWRYSSPHSMSWKQTTELMHILLSSGQFAHLHNSNARLSVHQGLCHTLTYSVMYLDLLPKVKDTKSGSAINLQLVPGSGRNKTNLWHHWLVISVCQL